VPRFKHTLLLLLGLLLFTSCAGKEPSHADPADEVAKTTLTRVGQMAPDFTVERIDGGTISLAEQRGKVVLVNFFATWCPPCKEEMPHLQTRIWDRFRSDAFVLFSVAREETPDIVAPFVAERELTWPFTVDPEREAFALYASGYIPRNYVLDRSGRIVYQSQGFTEEEFAEMIDVIKKELAQP